MNTSHLTCARCQEPIREGEPYDADAIDRQSGPPVTVYRHAASFGCKARQTRTTQSSIWR